MHVSSGPSKFVALLYYFLEAFLSREMFFRIYHNIRYQPHRLWEALRAFRLAGKPAKQATNHPKTRQKRAGSVFTACMNMLVPSAGNSRHSAGVSPVSGVLPIRKRWTGTQFIAYGLARCQPQPENPFSPHVQESSRFVDGRQSRCNESPRDSPHDSPAIRLVTWL